MDKRFQKVIENMDDLASRSENLLEEINVVFSKVKDTQNETNGKLDVINSKFKNSISDFESESKRIFSDVNQVIEEKKTKMVDSIETIQNALNQIDEEYKQKVGTLVQSIDKKSKEIFEIHTELENIRMIQQDAISKFDELSEKHNSIIESFKKNQEQLLDDSLIGKLKTIVESYEKRIQKLEKHAHKHAFGGTKI